MRGAIDPNVELLPDVPISGPEEDLFDRVPVARRVGELAIAGPVSAPRLVALTGDGGAGKSSVLRMVTSHLGSQAGLALIAFDANSSPTAAAVTSTLAAELGRLFEALGVVEATDKVRNTLSSYGGIVSSIAKLAGVRVDVAGALERSAESLRQEIAQNLEQMGKRLVIVIDHLDRLPAAELGGVLTALRMYAAIPYSSIVIAIDRRMTAIRDAKAPGADPTAFERLVQVELALPAADRVLLARVIGGALSRIGSRTGQDLDVALPLFDPDGGLGLALIETPRDAKRAANALSAAMPLAKRTADLHALALEIVLRTLVPEIDASRLAAREVITDKEALFEELAAGITVQRRAHAARAALRALVLDPYRSASSSSSMASPQ
ncbi:MAG: AAA family ATPase [Deltaproteobacteria bacterium]|nr:AAA family ATPase [Deltaproteobacteria bacterium]